MREQKLLAKEFEFYLADLDNMVLVQRADDGRVTIRCTRDNFSKKQKMFFIRELAAEGFIPDEYQWLSAATIESGVRWVKDWSWVKVPETVSGRTMKWVLMVGVVWLAAIRIAIVYLTVDRVTPVAKSQTVITYKAANQTGWGSSTRTHIKAPTGL